MEIQTNVTEFILMGFSHDPHLQIFLILVFLVIYLIILVGNMAIMLVIRVDPHLHSPMYIFLSHLSFVDICHSSVVFPKMLVNFLAKHKTISTISFLGCATQMYLFLLFGNSECCLLAVMSYDRYVAICNPMSYSLIMSRKVTIRLASVVWIAGNVVAFEQTVTIFKLSFHGSNKMEHFFYDVIPVLKLASTDTSLNDVINIALTVVFIIFPFALIITSYICILSTILKMRSAEGRHKAFFTCSSHLKTVTLFFGRGFITYMRPASSGSVDTNQAISLLYTVITPVFNPIIYSLRNKEVMEALRKLLGSSRTS
uniref:Olfactory receptor n=1 Tax=Chelonoidis abingdonii TaxID=106734 RepID=A0A8C0GLF8_CHEAB